MLSLAMDLPSRPVPELNNAALALPIIVVILVRDAHTLDTMAQLTRQIPCLLILSIQLSSKGPIIKGVPGAYSDLMLGGVRLSPIYYRTICIHLTASLGVHEDCLSSWS